MKLIIKSKQNYGAHIDEFVEEFQCSVEENEEELKINFEEGFIKLEENKMTYERKENKIVVEPEKTNECDYDTPYGMFVLDIKGLSLENNYINKKQTQGIIAIVKYEIQMVGVEPYENNIEIIIE